MLNKERSSMSEKIKVCIDKLSPKSNKNRGKGRGGSSFF